MLQHSFVPYMSLSHLRPELSFIGWTHVGYDHVVSSTDIPLSSLCSTLFSLMVFIQRSHWFKLSGYCNPVLYALGTPGRELSLHRHLSSRTVNVNTFTYEIHSCLMVLHLFILFSGISVKTNCIFFHVSLSTSQLFKNKKYYLMGNLFYKINLNWI